MPKVTGNLGNIAIDALTIQVQGWELTHEAEEEDSTTTESNGNELVEPVIERAMGSFEGFIDLAALPGGTTPVLKGGTKGTFNLFVGDPVNNKKYTFPGMIRGITVTSRVKALVKLNGTFRSDGAITPPST